MKSIHKDLVYFGSEFRRLREEKNYSWQDIELATSLRLHHIRAIEDGNIGELISPVYARGFIKNYADFLGLNVEEMLHRYPYVGSVFKVPHSGSASNDLRFSELRDNRNRRSNSSLKIFFWAGIIGFVWLIAYFCDVI
ncbi:MAG: helix-turn-helix domain-containing protein [Victivallaceae bacterium]